MSSNVGLPTPRGSGTSGYVQRNLSFLKPRNIGYGAPYPPVSGPNAGVSSFKQRKPDQKILDHDRKRAIELKVLEEQERLEEENDRIKEEEEARRRKVKDTETGNQDSRDRVGKNILSEEEIEERCDALRKRLLKGLEDENTHLQHGPRGNDGPEDRYPRASGFNGDNYNYRRRRDGYNSDALPKERRQFKSYQVHELAEAKIQETERLRKALGIKEDWENGGRQQGASPRKNRDRE
jgi:cwf21 domain-containing protein